MKKAISMLLAAVFSIVWVTPAMAGRVKNRQVKQQARIHQGVQSGELTCREVKGLQKEQRHIQHVKKRSWSDGTMTRKEKFRLEQLQDTASRHIYKLKHNDIDR